MSIQLRFLIGLALALILNADVLAVSTDSDGFNPLINNTVYALAVQPDGKTLVSGNFNSVNATSRNGIARLNIDGSLDTSFDPGMGANSFIFTITLQADGKVIVGGNFTSFDGVARSRIARLNSDGSLDTSFDPGSGANDGSVLTLAMQADGKVLAGGNFTGFNGSTQRYLVRLNVDGSRDTSFNLAITDDVYAVFVQSDGKILIGGGFAGIHGNGRNNIARLNANGSLDTGFIIGFGANNSVQAISQRVDGKILIGGNFTSFNGTTKNRLALLNTDGSLDASFNSGTGANDTVRVMLLQTDGKVLVGGNFTNIGGFAANRIARLNPEGDFDTSFNTKTGVDGNVFALSQQTDHRVIIGGSFSQVSNTERSFIARLNANGDLDHLFDVGEGTNGIVNSVLEVADGKLVIGGDFTSVDGIANNYIARLNADGSVDTSFQSGTGANGRIYKVSRQLDGKLLIAGEFTSFNGFARNKIARLNSNGSLDGSFNTNVVGIVVTAISPLSDGKILIGGAFTAINGTTTNGIARLNSNGSLDSSFNTNINNDAIVFSISQRANGKLYIGGSFTSVNGTSRNRIARLNADGSLDISFNPGSGANNFIAAIAEQGDGKIIIAGAFNRVNGNVRNNTARLNTNGTLDQSYEPGAGVNTPGIGGTISSISIQANGKILLGGNFIHYDNEPNFNSLARVNPSGTLDRSFDTTELSLFNVSDVALQENGRILLGSALQGGVVRLVTNVAASQSLSIDENGRSIRWFRGGTSPDLLRATFEYAANLYGEWTPLGDVRKSGSSWHLGGLTLPIESIGYIRARGYSAHGQNASIPSTESITQFYLQAKSSNDDDSFCFPIKASNGNIVLICL